jgi:hypothetical protein
MAAAQASWAEHWWLMARPLWSQLPFFVATRASLSRRRWLMTQPRPDWIALLDLRFGRRCPEAQPLPDWQWRIAALLDSRFGRRCPKARLLPHRVFPIAA